MTGSLKDIEKDVRSEALDQEGLLLSDKEASKRVAARINRNADIAHVASSFISMMAGLDVGITSYMAGNALTNNFLAHQFLDNDKAPEEEEEEGRGTRFFK